MKFAITFVLIAAALAFDFTEKTEKSGIVFVKMSEARVTYDSYTLLYHFDIGNYLDMTEKLSDCMNGLKKLCNWIRPSNCELILQNLEHHFNYMKSDVTEIYAYRIYQRTKRGLFNFGGKILHWLYGLMDEDTARGYAQKINEIGNVTIREHALQAEQLLIIKETIRVNNDSFNILNNKLDNTMKNLADIQGYSVKKIENLQLDERFLELTNVAQLIIMEHARLSSQILDSLENTINGKISQLIPLQVLTEDIGKLSQALGENQRMPIDVQEEDVLHIFKFSATRAALIGKRLLIEMTIPVVERTEYSLHRSIPVPIKIGEQTRIISSHPQYFLISNDLREYILIDEAEYSDAKTNRKGELIFSPAQNVHFAYDSSCEISIFMSSIKNSIAKICNTNVIPSAVYFVAIEQNSIYYVYTEKTVHILEHCNGKPSTINALETSGYLKLNRKCRINTDKISIRPHLNTRLDSPKIIELSETTNNLTLETLTEIIGEIPASIDLKSDDSILIQNHDDDYRKLVAKTDNLIKENAYEIKFEQIGYGNIKTGIISSGSAISITMIAIIVIFFILYKKFFNAATWIKLAKKLENQSENIPKLFIKKIYVKRNDETSFDE